LTHYQVDIRDTKANLLAKDVAIRCDMWELNENLLMLKLSLATSEMGKRENRDKLAFRHPEADYRATVKKVTTKIRIITTTRTIAVEA
jgi:hypothetical protein